MSEDCVRKNGAIAAGVESVTIHITRDNVSQLLADFAALRKGRYNSLIHIADGMSVKLIRGDAKLLTFGNAPDTLLELDEDTLDGILHDLEHVKAGGKVNANHFDDYIPIKGKNIEGYLTTVFAEGMYQFDNWPSGGNDELAAFAREWDKGKK